MQSKVKDIEKIFTYSKDRRSFTFAVKVKAGAKYNAIEDIVCIGQAWYLKLTIKALPFQGKANKAIIELLSEEWSLQKKAIKIVKGNSSSYKLIEINQSN